MTLSSFLGSLTRRAETKPAAPRRPVSNPSSSPDVMALVEANAVRFVPRGDARALGLQREVRERIADVLPGVTFDDDGQGAFTRTGYSVMFDTGSADVVTEVRAQITGGVAAIPPLQRLAAKTNWRLEPVDS